MNDYVCEHCGIDRGSYAAQMACEQACEDEARLARRGFANAGPVRHTREWDDD